MSPGEERTHATRLTARGAVTRERILAAAAELMRVKGVAATTFDEVRAASGTSKSQIYHHFADKDALVREVVAFWGRWRLDQQEQELRRLSSLAGLKRWRDALIHRNALVHGGYGCVLGSLAHELADGEDDVRVSLAADFAAWEQLLADGFDRMRGAGVLRADADPLRLAVGLMAALQGGYLLAQTARDTTPMEIALDMAIDHVKTFAPNTGDTAGAAS